MGGRALDVERPDHGFSLEQVFEHLVDFGILLAVVAFSILLAVPKAQAQDTAGFDVRRQND